MHTAADVQTIDPSWQLVQPVQAARVERSLVHPLSSCPAFYNAADRLGDPLTDIPAERNGNEKKLHDLTGTKRPD